MTADRKNRRPQRRAFTLIEMVAVCALTSTLMSLVGIALLRMYRIDRQVRDEIRLIDSCAELGTRFRADAHAAILAVPIENGAAFTTPDELTIEYRVKELFVERQVRRGDEVRHRDTFRIPRGFAVQFVGGETASPPRVSLAVSRRTASPPSPEVFRIEATVGLHGSGGLP